MKVAVIVEVLTLLRTVARKMVTFCSLLSYSTLLQHPFQFFQDDYSNVSLKICLSDKAEIRGGGKPVNLINCTELALKQTWRRLLSQ